MAHPAAPFRLAALATHPREGGGQVTWRRRTLPQTLPIPFCGGEGDHALQTCLPPLVGGRGTTKWWKGAAEGGIIKTAAKPLPPSSEPGPRSGPSSRPLPSRCARHPPPGRGWAGNMEEKNVALKTCRLWVERNREAAEGGIIKNCGEAATTTLGPKGRRPLSEANHNPSTQPAAPAAPLFLNCGEAATTTL